MQAIAATAYFTLVMRRNLTRPQVRTAEKITNKLSPSAKTVTKFIRTKYLSHADVGGMVSSPPSAIKAAPSTANRMTHTSAATCVVPGNHCVPGCGDGIGLWPRNIRLA